MLDLQTEIEQLVQRALEEDIRTGDVTSLACIDDARETSAVILMKQSGIIAGLPLLPMIFKGIHPAVEITYLTDEGSFQKVGSQVAKVTGPVRAIITGERVALNFLQHTSGVATITSEYVKRVAHMRCDILDTRKTLPGLRALEKYAVAVGGGKNHRNGLNDCALIKSSHLSYIEAKEDNPIETAVEKIKEKYPDLPIEIQIDAINEVVKVLTNDFRAIMLRNMSLDDLTSSIELIRQANSKVYIAYTGRVTLETVRSIAETGVNGISVPSLTHSVQGIDIGIRLK